MSDTPRTDAIVISGNAERFLSMCRKLERELAAAQAQEPVRWLYQMPSTGHSVCMETKRDWADNDSGLWTETPLYALRGKECEK